jgi:hypothetical protein
LSKLKLRTVAGGVAGPMLPDLQNTPVRRPKTCTTAFQQMLTCIVALLILASIPPRVADGVGVPEHKLHQ